MSRATPASGSHPPALQKDRERFLIIAVDGEAASGKTTACRGAGKRLGLLIVETGAHYRAMTAHLLKKGVPPDAPEQVTAVLAETALDTRIEDGESRLLINGQATPAADLRQPQVNEQVSGYAASVPLRQCLGQYQRGLAVLARQESFPGLIMEGRDIGSVIFPEAPLRFFLTACPEAREQRRAREGQTDSVRRRDDLDSTRAIAPLRQTGGAIRIDTTRLEPGQTVEIIVAKALAWWTDGQSTYEP